MEKYIKYKRINELVSEHSLQKLFDNLITDGWEIINYNEIESSDSLEEFFITIIVGKKQNNVI